MSAGCGGTPTVIERDIPYDEIQSLIVNNDARPAFSIPLAIRGMTVRDQFEECMNLFTALSRKHYADEEGRVNLLNWTEENGKKINKYFHSIGLMFNMWTTDINDPTLEELEKRKFDRLHLTRQTQLSELLFIMRINDSDRVVIISFDNLPLSLLENPSAINSLERPEHP